MTGAETWMKVGDTPRADPRELGFLGLGTHSPHLAQYNAGQVGKKADYILGWVSSRGDKGPWSETARATIGG